MLPRTAEGPELVGVVTESAAAATGLRAGTAVVGGAGDQAANAVGVGAVSHGVAALSVGTSGVVFAPTDHPVFESNGRLQAFCHAVPDMWHLMGVTLSAAGSLKWLREELAPNASWAELTARPQVSRRAPRALHSCRISPVIRRHIPIRSRALHSWV